MDDTIIASTCPTAPASTPDYRRIRDLVSLYDGTAVPRASGTLPRIAVVGGGLGGLVAAHLLAAAGYALRLFDAAAQVGGRVRTDRQTLLPGVVSELGGEFIDTPHADIHALARRFGCTLIDTWAPSERGLGQPCRFGGRRFDHDDVARALKPFAARIAADAAVITRRSTRRIHTDADRRFDDMSIARYLKQLGMDDWLAAAIGVAYTTLNGLDAEEQSSLNLLKHVSKDRDGGLSLFGSSDERWKVVEGMDRIIGGLVGGLAASTSTDHHLRRITRRNAALELSFDTRDGVRTCAADVVILALPFTMLRRVEADGVFSPAKQAAIAQLAYGTNSKVLVTTRRRIWRDQGGDGGFYSDGMAQTGWDSSRLRGGEQGVLTFFLGGRMGLDIGAEDAATQASRLSAEMEHIWPGFSASRTGAAMRVHWPSDPGVMGSYSTYSVGQHTRLGGDESTPEGNVYFAGEHCSPAHQGYMQGAAESGRRAAMAILKRLVS